MRKTHAQAIQHLVLMTQMVAEPSDEFLELLQEPSWGKIRKLWFSEAVACFPGEEIPRIWDEVFKPILEQDLRDVHGI